MTSLSRGNHGHRSQVAKGWPPAPPPGVHSGQLCWGIIKPWGLCHTQQSLPPSHHPSLTPVYPGSGVSTHAYSGSKVSSTYGEAGVGLKISSKVSKSAQHWGPTCLLPVSPTQPAFPLSLVGILSSVGFGGHSVFFVMCIFKHRIIR